MIACLFCYALFSHQYKIYHMKQDLFGFESQGIKYDIYRPKYPNSMLTKMVARLKNKNRYLDVATGTGQIIFEICQHFQKSKGIDLSKKMIEVCKNKVQQRKLKGVTFQCQDFMTSKLTDKYDLITIGQALHWLPIKQFLQKSKDNLEKQGELTVFGYILNKLQGQTADQTAKLTELYHQFYDKRVKKNFDFDRDELHTHYSDKQRYPFEQVFPKVTRETIQIPIPMDKNGLISYLQTFSGYNTYLERFPQEKDPIENLKTSITEGTKIKCIFDYFSITCSL